MLRSLGIRDMLLIDRLDLEFQPGLNVLTGETGAGKSILLDSLGFVLGWRGRADLVRQGAAQGEVEAVFDLPVDHPGRTVLADAGISAEDEIILRRVNTADGRKTAWINDRRASGEVLRALSDTLVELHGQHDDRGLLNPRGHRDLLDAFAGVDLTGLRHAWRDLSRAERAHADLLARIESLRSEEEFLRHAVKELDALDPQPGEEAELDTRRRLMQSAVRLRGDIERARAAVGEEGAEQLTRDALRWVEGAVDGVEGRLDAAVETLERILGDLAEAQDQIDACLDALDTDPRTLEEVEERLFALRGLARKHGVLPDDLGAHAEALRERLGTLDAGDKGAADLARAVRAARERYDTARAQISTQRANAATRLDAAMATELAPLKMERAVFQTVITATDPGSDGADAVTFQVATNPGAPAGALNKIASGGELSRFLLALKVCLSGDIGGLTMIFDEIDRGVGGATADAVGRRLHRLAQGGQVLVVTHSPQVAALGAHHWRVEKTVQDEQTLSRVVPLEPDARVDEIARMISGDTISDAARGAARALLDARCA